MYFLAFALVSTAISIFGTHAQTETPDGSFFNITTFPNEQKANVTRYLNEALELAGYDLYAHFATRCILNQVYPDLGYYAQAHGYIKPFQPFSGVYFVGESAVSSWAIDTGEGLVVFDTLYNATEVETILLPGIKSFGFSPDDIRYVIHALTERLAVGMIRIMVLTIK